MIDPRLEQLANKLVTYSCDLQQGENCLIEATDIDSAFVALLVKEVYKAGGTPHVWLRDSTVQRAVYAGASREDFEKAAAHDSAVMQQMQAYIGVRAAKNSFELSDLPPAQTELYNSVYSSKVHGQIRVPKTKWVVLRYPNASMSQLAKMSTEAFEDFFFSVCNLDYAKMSKAMDMLAACMERADRVHIVGKGTDLHFSIKGMRAVKCDGLRNIPDGEVYTAPIRSSLNGTITYTTPSVHEGFTFENISFTFKDGKIVEASANDSERLNRILDTDEGARYVGEFSFGINPYITNAILDTLFDEKIDGSIHLTPGQAYDDADNGNRSAIHWDLVYIQRPEYGGGEIYFDDVLIRKDGRFVLPELQCCNAENLK